MTCREKAERPPGLLLPPGTDDRQEMRLIALLDRAIKLTEVYGAIRGAEMVTRNLAKDAPVLNGLLGEYAPLKERAAGKANAARQALEEYIAEIRHHE